MSTDMKHTPGPWMLEGNWSPDSKKLGGWVSTIHPSPLFSLEPITGNPANIIANARLIAAAPDLLEALKAMTEEWVDYTTINHLGDPWAKHNMKLARAAIDKATGSPSTERDGGEAKRSTPENRT